MNWNNFKIIRWYKKGIWFKTKYGGWITYETYMYYLGYGFDPLYIKEEKYW